VSPAATPAEPKPDTPAPVTTTAAPAVAVHQTAETGGSRNEPQPLAPAKAQPAVIQQAGDSRPPAPALAPKAEPEGENLVQPGRSVEGSRLVEPMAVVQPISLEESRRNDAQHDFAQLDNRPGKPQAPEANPLPNPTPPQASLEGTDGPPEAVKAKVASASLSTAAQIQAAQAAEKAADAENAKAAAKEANLRQASTSSAAMQHGLAQQQSDSDKTRHQSEPESKSLRKIEDKSENTGGSAKSGRGTESEQARRQMQQQQRTQQNSRKASQQESSSSKTRYITRPQEAEESDDIATSDETTMKSCDKCGYTLGGSADLACPVCSTEQPDLALRLFTQVRQMGTHWITFADTLAVTDGAREALAETNAAPVQLQFVPRIPKFSQVLRLKQQL